MYKLRYKQSVWGIEHYKVVKDGFDAMTAGEGDVVSGWQNKLQTTLANVTPAGVLAEQHRRTVEPGSGEEEKE